MIGQIAIHLLFGLAVMSTVLYFLSIRRGDAYTRIARTLFGILAIGLVASASALVILILQHRFEYTYVQSYSSRELPLHLLIATFYSGQEGSFLLWTMLVALIGVALMPYARRHGYESQSMAFYGLILCFLTLLMVAKNPFAYVWETYARDGVALGFIPEKGRGLNPLLHNAWITIHPPILFTGFASMSVSFVFAMAGLVKRDYHRWIDVALPWTLFGTCVLGFGIMLGGFWAYETLGWGGFWGWDPVENSSLIPWLVSVALVHTMLVQKRTRGLTKTNMILAVSAFVMVLYSTFLTRSGVLGDTSVHSFVDPGKFAFWILLVFMLTFTILGVTLVVRRRADMNVNREEFDPKTREFMLSIGAALIMASAVLVTIGTSWPVLMEIVGQPKVAVAIDFYNRVHIILLPAILLVNGLSLLMQWRTTTAGLFKRRIIMASAISLGCTAISVVLGVRDGVAILLAVGAWFALVVNVQIAATLVRRAPATIGAYISHAGIALLVFGIITTANYSETHHAVLTQGVPASVGEYTLTFLGKEQIEKHFADREKFEYAIRIQAEGTDRVVKPVLYWSDFNQRQSAFLEPGIRWGLMNDLYVAPKAYDTEDVLHRTTIRRDTMFSVPIDSSWSFTFNGFTMPMTEERAPDGRMRMSAMLLLQHNHAWLDTMVRVPTRITQASTGMSFDPEWTTLPGSSIGVGLVNITRNNDDPTKSTGELVFRDMSKPMPVGRDIFTVEFAVKPLISLVWTGVITMVLGFVVSIVRYGRLSKQHAALRRRQDTPVSDAQVAEPQIADRDAQQA